MKILIIGGGFSGMAAAIALRREDHAVELVEIDPNWRSYGAGISLGGATFRALRSLGVLDAFLRHGFAADGVDICLPHGPKVMSLPTPRLAGPDTPGAGAIMRPVLARILADAVRASGASVHLGCTFTSIAQDGQAVDVAFSDGRRGRYDLVIGADGLYSKVRAALFSQAPKPRYMGQAVWRAVVPRPADVNHTIMWVGPKVKVGVNPVSDSEMYMFVTEDRASNAHVDPEHFHSMLDALLAPFPADLVQRVRTQLHPHSQIVFRPLEGLLLSKPWHVGRVQLIGDAVHATTPHLASGACIGIEDALVLAAELAASDEVAVALEGFEVRRWERCRMVVESSARLCDIEITGGDKDEHSRIMRESLMALAQPI